MILKKSILALNLVVLVLFSFKTAKGALNATDTIINSRNDFDQKIKFLTKMWVIRSSDNLPKTKEELLTISSKCHEWALKNGDESLVVMANFYILRYQFYLKQYDYFIHHGTELLHNPVFQQDTNVFALISYLQRTYHTLEHYEEVINLYPLAQKIYSIHSKELSLSDFIVDDKIAEAYFRLGNFQAAIRNYKRSYGNYLAKESLLDASSRLNDIGLCFSKLKQWDSALFYYDLALATLHKKHNGQPPRDDYDYYFYRVINSNKSDYQFYHDQADVTIPIYQEELIGAKKYDDRINITSIYLKLGEYHYSKRDVVKAKKYVDSALVTIAKQEFKKQLPYAYSLAAKCAFLEKKYDLADQYLTRIELFNDSLKHSRSKRNYLISSVKFELAKKDSDLALSQQKLQSAKQRNFYILMGVVLASVLSMILFFFYRKVKRDKQRISDQKQKTDIALEEKETLLKEIHHRVKNNLQVVSSYLDLQSGKLKDPKYNLITSEAQKYIDSMSLVHQMLYQNKHVSNIQVGEYLTKLCGHLKASQFNQLVDVEIMASNENISLEKATPLGLITTELVSNSFKHAFPKKAGNITISFSQTGKNSLFIYQDDGVGLANKQYPNESRTLGFRLLYMLAEEMDAKVEITPYPFTFTLNFTELNHVS